MKEIKEFIDLSILIGERFDLTQAGGGNTSVKIDSQKMVIKSSGFLLSEIARDKGYSLIKYRDVEKILRDKSLFRLRSKKKRDVLVRQRLKKTVLGRQTIPSIEIFLHALLDKYTIHVHPLVATAVMSQKDHEKILRDQKINNYLLVRYKTPGIELGWELLKSLSNLKASKPKQDKIIFLENHGLVVSSDDYNSCLLSLNKTLIKLEKYMNLDLSDYKLVNKVSEYVNAFSKEKNIAYLSQDKIINEIVSKNKKLFSDDHFCPDSVVYCGKEILRVNSFNNKSLIKGYFNKHKMAPAVILFKKRIFITAKSLKKAREIEDVLRSSLMIRSWVGNKLNCLSKTEVKYLSNWEAENYRRKL